MSEPASNEPREQQLAIVVLSISAGLVGVCLTAIGLLRVHTGVAKVATIGDELLALDASLYMVCCLFAFWAIKTKRSRTRRVLGVLMDLLFMLALGFMVIVCGLITYTVV